MIYDLAIVGGGAAALSAGVYAGRSLLNTIIIEKDSFGGQTSTTSLIVNYPGIKEASGPALIREMREQALDFGCVFQTGTIIKTDFSRDVKVLTDSKGNEIKAYAVLIATGTTQRTLGFPGEKEYTGNGITYCATCDGASCAEMEIFIIGGGYAAAEESVYLSQFAKKVNVMIRDEDFSCAKATANLAKDHDKVNVYYHTEIKEVAGDEGMDKLVFVNRQTGEELIFDKSHKKNPYGMFIFAGSYPNTSFVSDHIDCNSRGYIVTNDKMETNIPGVYAAGDLREKELRQVVTAVADGAIAATVAGGYISNIKKKTEIKTIIEIKNKETNHKK